MKTIKSIIAFSALAALSITATSTISASAVSEQADNDTIPNFRPVQELDPVSLADFMDNPYPNSFCDFRIVTNAEMKSLNTVIVGEEMFLLSDWGFYSETPNVYVLFNTRGTTDITDDEIIGVYESPIDEVSELALYEQIYTDMWNLR